MRNGVLITPAMPALSQPEYSDSARSLLCRRSQHFGGDTLFSAPPPQHHHRSFYNVPEAHSTLILSQCAPVRHRYTAGAVSYPCLLSLRLPPSLPLNTGWSATAKLQSFSRRRVAAGDCGTSMRGGILGLSDIDEVSPYRCARRVVSRLRERDQPSPPHGGPTTHIITSLGFGVDDGSKAARTLLSSILWGLVHFQAVCPFLLRASGTASNSHEPSCIAHSDRTLRLWTAVCSRFE